MQSDLSCAADPKVGFGVLGQILASLRQIGTQIGRSCPTEPHETFWIVPVSSFDLPAEVAAVDVLAR
jgi:hypothetical protein